MYQYVSHHFYCLYLYIDISIGTQPTIIIHVIWAGYLVIDMEL